MGIDEPPERAFAIAEPQTLAYLPPAAKQNCVFIDGTERPDNNLIPDRIFIDSPHLALDG